MQNCETKFGRIFENGNNFGLLKVSDANLRTDDGCTFDVHRVILAKSSDYFRAMFCHMGNGRREFKIPGISGENLSDILCYVYTGDIEVTERNASDLIIAADYLLMKDLGMKIKQETRVYITEASCLRILQAAHQIGDGDIFRESFRFIQTRFERIMRGQKDDLADLPLDILSSILSDRSLYVYNETTVWLAIVEWTQKDIPVRLSYVPQLLLTLAVADVGEELASEILQHEIITNNTFMKDLAEIISSNGRRQDLQMDQISKRKKISDLDMLLSYLREISTRFTEPNSHRIPLKLHVMSCYTGGEDEDRNSDLYVTYDEKPDILHKIIEVNSKPDVLIVIGQNMYIFEMAKDFFMKFDFRTMDSITISFRHYYGNSFVVAIDAYIYVFGEILDEEEGEVIDEGTYNVDVYDTANNSWFDLIPMHNITDGSAVTIEKKIYVVGENFGVPMMQMFDPITQQWSHLSPPTFYGSNYKLVAYHKKIYLMGHSDVNPEVFDPATNLWKKLPNLPYAYLSPNAVVFNDQILFHDSSDRYKRNAKNVRWNDAKECWEKLDETYILSDLHLLRLQPFCTVDDVETIRMFTKHNRDPKVYIDYAPEEWLKTLRY